MVLAGITLLYLPDRPAEADWLAPDERHWLSEEVSTGPSRAGVEVHGSFTESVRDPRVLFLTGISLCRVTCLYGVTFFLPQVVGTIGGSMTTTALLSAIPYIVGALGMLALAYTSDRMQERRWHVFFTFILMAGGLSASAIFGKSSWAIVALSIATFFGRRCLAGCDSRCFYPGHTDKPEECVSQVGDMR